MLTIRTAPGWAERGGHSPRGTHNPDPGYLKKFARAAALHYQSDVHIWGVWNEPNYKTFLSPQYKRGKLVSPAMYRKLLNAAASSIHGVTGPTGSLRARPPRSRTGTARASRPPLARCSSCASSSASTRSGHSTCKTNVHADIFATHPYTSGNAYHHAFNANDVSFGDLSQWND